MITLTLLPALALCAPLQEALVVGEWTPLNRVDLIVNEECITARDIQFQVLQLGRDMTTQEEQQQLWQAVTTREITRYLKVGAGRDRGFDPDLIKRIVLGQHEDRLERAKSVASMADQYQLSDIDSASYFEDTESAVLAMLWTRSVVGLFPGPGGRNYVDRYVRPGRLLFEFERRKNSLALPTLITLQQLRASPLVAGSLEEARILAEKCREEILAGADFGQVAVDNRCAPEETQGVEGPYELELLSTIPGLGEFFASAEPGDVSEVLGVREDGSLKGFRVIKLLELKEKRAASFVDEEFQRVLAQRIQENRDRLRENLAVRRRLKAAYVWPPESFGRAGVAGE